ERHASRVPEGGRAGPADGPDRPHAAPLRRDRPAETITAHRGGAPPLHGGRRRPLAAGALATAARLLPGGGPRLPGTIQLFAARGDPSPRRPPAGTDRAHEGA